VSGLVLSIFPGMDALGMAFEDEGFCVVRGPDVILGQDVRSFHPPIRTFDGVIGGDPCQEHSPLANLGRAQGRATRFGDLSGEYVRAVEEAMPAWFLRENVRQAPEVKPLGYSVHSFEFDCAWLGCEQARRRLFSFGIRTDSFPRNCERRADLRRWLEVSPISGGTKQTVTGRHPGAIGRTGGHRGQPAHYTLAQMLELQGLPADCLQHSPFTERAKRKLVANAVPIPMGRALARAVRMAMD
jgi:DNA (cytosine-5)-methyltransferase 1